MGGRELHFRLAGINNQNFLMRDEETGTWWQQVSGAAIFGPLQGQFLELAPSDELSFGLWRQEAPAGLVLAPIVADQGKYEDNWEPEVQKYPTPFNFPGLEARDVIVGLNVNGMSRAYPLTALEAQSPIHDRLGRTPIVLVLGPDGKSIRAFVGRLEGADLELFRKSDSTGWALIDASGGPWNFQGCATEGAAKGKCLERLPLLKDYWFDWRNYHPNTGIYRH